MSKNSIKLKNILFAIIFSLIAVSEISAQGVPLIGPEKIPDDPSAETTARRWWYMDGNRVWLKFFNDGMLGNFPDPLSSIWPKGSGINMNDGLAVIVQSKLNVTPDGVPLPTGVEPDTSKGEGTLYFCQTYFREDMDVDPSGAFNWGFYPVVGYLNLDQDKPAISNDDNSWPIGGWADEPDFVDSAGVTEWNGYFGRGKTNADLEAYYVTNDSWDLEFQQDQSSLPPFYPRPGKVLPGGKYQWGGLGFRIGARLFQWAHPQAQDAVFVHYDIANISDYDFDKIIMSFYIDSGIGDDWSTMDKTLNMCWIFDQNGVGAGGRPLGIMAFAFLESPGIKTDGIDNDDDGLTDESRVPLGDAERWTDDPMEGISNVTKFKEFYYPQEPKPHWVGDENQNWRSWLDADSSGGDFDPSIDLIRDDVGSDGVGPEDPNYYGPDLNGTEANSRPDDGEPNYNKTDKDESDQIGLTSFQAWDRNIYKGSDPTKDREFQYDEMFWNLTSKGEFNPYLLEGKINPIELFASGPIPINSWRKERFSIAELHTWDKPFKEPNFEAPLLFVLKKTVQRIYNSNYRFAKPPEKPILTAIAGDSKVTLLWDEASEKSKEPFFNYIEDFEGYKVIRSTEPYFEDDRVITDGFGTEIFLKPVAQFDLIDGIKGFADWSIYNGVSYYLGKDSGLEHIYIDRDVMNGRTYYYAVVAYDFGMDSVGLAPSENTATITLNESDEITFVDRNCAVVVPHAFANGYLESTVDSNWVTKEGTGDISIKRVDEGKIVEGTKYTVKFSERREGYDPDKAAESGLSDDKIFEIFNDTLFVFNTTTDSSLTDTAYTMYIRYAKDKYNTERFDGLVLGIDNPSIPTMQQYFWKDPQTDISVYVEESQKPKGGYKTVSTLPEVPWDYSIHFTKDTNYTATLQRFGLVSGMNLLPGQPLTFYALNHNYHHKEWNGTDSVLVPDTAAISIVDANKNGIFDWHPNDPFSDYLIIGEFDFKKRIDWGDFVDLDYCMYAYNLHFLDKWPKPGDVFNIRTNRPFRATDTYKFEITESVDFDAAAVDMDMIKVVPNPYRGTNLMEPYVREGLHQRRRLMFTHIPAKSTITIFSLNGYVVQQLHVDNPPSDGKVVWDMQTKEGLEIAYGLYIYKVESPGIGEKVGKFAVIK
ncbi:putative lipoprotein [hydrothermal vent metagenome]|uniref:Putative lipoprotein n=1 Tax=hydrothermal vent metagenome TaxID=652676 RepID=A0A3B1C5J7_9ZZZZ